MKKIYILLILFLSGVLQAQVVNIPDANLKAKLLSASPSNFVALTGMSSVAIDTNGNGEIEEAEATVITGLILSDSQISDATGLESFSNLESLLLDNNSLGSINLSSFTDLTALFLGQNQLTSIDLSPLVNLERLGFESNQITAIDFSNLPQLWEVNCSNNLLEALDFSQNPLFEILFCQDNPNLQFINVKNGLHQLMPDSSWNMGTSLQFVCADEGELETAQALAGNLVAVSSYCTFSPGGNYNTVSGTVRFDPDGSGCDNTNDPVSLVRIGIDDGSESGSSFTSVEGTYELYSGAGNFSLFPILENPSYFTVSPANPTVNFPSDENLTHTQDFCLSPNGSIDDVEVVLSPVSSPVVGSQVVYQVTLRNKGNQTLSQPLGVSCTYDYAKMDLISTSPPIDGLVGSTVSWSYANLQPFETRSFFCTMEIHTPTDVYPVNLGDEIQLSAAATLASDADGSDNSFTLIQQAVSSFDPNDILCLEGEEEPTSAIGDFLHYRIRFENTGNATAQNVVLRLPIDPAKYNVGSLQMLQTSHPASIRLKNDVLEVIFESINMDSGGHGNVLLKVRSQNQLQQGDSVMQRAAIYFDYNLPVGTNLAETVFEDLSATDTPQLQLSVYPNPATDKLFVVSAQSFSKAEIYDASGRLIKFAGVVDGAVDLHEIPSGLYYVKLSSETGFKTMKFIKE